MTIRLDDTHADAVLLDVPSPRAVAHVLAVVGIVLVLLGVVATVLELSQPEFPGRENIIVLLSLKSEFNIPTVVSSLWLAACATLLIVVARVQHARRAQYVKQWILLSGIFVYLAIDEGARLHERLNEPLSALSITTGALRWGWVLVGGAVVVLLSAVYLRFVVALPSPERAGVVAAGGMYVSGALFMELVGAGTSEGAGLATPQYLTLTIIEESLELGGIGLFIVTLWALLRRWAPQLTLRHPVPAAAPPVSDGPPVGSRREAADARDATQPR